MPAQHIIVVVGQCEDLCNVVTAQTIIFLVNMCYIIERGKHTHAQNNQTMAVAR